ncbi:amino acid adenylation domain-containing protein [Amycolatopsis xylanica]|uniref:Amino acid adenylation domain-containing protein n=1 Tax=Amycolatopsis xylanica TaxID=589385 RepID=A0A1H3PLF9_9PSEU|nr:non-ribosomal peptide synthetase [Amycolatopsis xylanica]SDZ01818.1 amino acid adenylation domain-containing protein [Amycolatopsis xylanica]
MTSQAFSITGSQQGLLVVHTRAAGQPVYNMLVRFDLDPRLDAARVEAAIAAMVAMQPALRQTFGVLPEMHARLTPATPTVPCERVIVAAAEFEEAVATTAQRIGRPEFDLENGPAYRFATVRASDDSASVILLADHHIVLDGLSVGPMVGDLERMLTEPLTRAEIDAKVELRERAYLKEMAAQLRSSTSEAALERSAAWAERLRAVPPLELAPRPGRPTQTSFSGARVRWRLDDAEATALAATCQDLNVSPFVLFTGIYGAVLARHGNVPEVLVGSPFLARRTVGAFDLCGFFVNTLPVTVGVDWTRPVADHLSTVVTEAIDFCRSNTDISFTQLVADVRPDRTTNRNPLFSAMVAMQDTFTAGPGGPVRRVTEPGNDTAKFDLWLGLTPVDGTWLLELEYDQELIAPAVADDLLTSLRTALRRTIADSSLSLAELFSDASAAASTRSDGWRAEPQYPTLVEGVEATARRTPDAIAIDEPGHQVTYAELVAAVERASGGLAERGIGRGDLVGLAADNLVDTVTAVLAILRRGAAFLPLDESLPKERLTYMAGKAECRLVAGNEVVPGVSTVAIKELAEAEPGEATGDPDAPVYVMFTSGSTGTPKGVQMGQRWLTRLAAWQIDALRMDHDTRFLQYAPLGFDVCFQEILPTLLSGGTVISRGAADRRDFAAVLKRIAESEATHVYLPVAALRPLVLHALDRGTRLPALRKLCVSGEQLLVDEQLREFFVQHPHCELVNHYGPTETQAVTTRRLSAEDGTWPVHVPIGTPLPGVAAYVVDATGHLAPTGVPGELFLGGHCLSDGYRNDPVLTGERFVPDTFAGSGLMYRTGDLVVRDHRGELIFLGRLDTQVKIRGNRVELSEIEAVATRVLGVRQAVAVVHGEGAAKEIALLLVPHPGATPEPDRVRTHIAATLPEYMRPLWIFTVDAIPATPTGKTDRRALGRILDEQLAAQREVEAPVAEYESDLERELAALWARVLKTDGILRDRPVLEYGAHSLNIFTTFAEIQQTYGVTLTMGEFFASPTIATLASLIHSAQEDE